MNKWIVRCPGLQERLSDLGYQPQHRSYTPLEVRVIVDALAMAGDMTVYGLRNDIKLIREDANGKQEIIPLDLNKAETILSPYYWDVYKRQES